MAKTKAKSAQPKRKRVSLAEFRALDEKWRKKFEKAGAAKVARLLGVSGARERAIATLRAERDKLSGYVDELKSKLARVLDIERENCSEGTGHGERLIEARGLLHAAVEEAGMHTVLTNRIRRFLGRNDGVELDSRIQRELAEKPVEASADSPAVSK